MSSREPPEHASEVEKADYQDPLGRQVVRDDVVDQAVKKLVEHLDKQVRPNLTQSEFAQVIERAKKELSGEPLEEMAY